MLLPGRLDLSREYRVSLFTLQRAVADLLEDGTLCADSRKGTYVSETADVAPLGSLQFDPPIKQSAPRVVGTLAIITSVLSEAMGASGFWLPSVIRAAEDTFREAGGSVFVINRLEGEDPRQTLRHAIRVARDQGASAVAVLEMNEIGHEIGEALPEIEVDGFPFVCTSGDDVMAPIPHICYDSRQAGYEAANHLIKQGCMNILYFAPFEAKWSSDRLEGVRQAVRDAGFTSDSLCVFPDPDVRLIAGSAYDKPSFQQARLACEAGLVKQGVIAQNDHVAWAFARAVALDGLKAGQDYALVGFDDVTESVMAGISTMRPPLESMGREAALSVIDALTGKPPIGHLRLRSQLIVRASSQMKSSTDEIM